jgi:8-oxo-dGTP pyrophosphatase MutT (NUDIX family)
MTRDAIVEKLKSVNGRAPQRRHGFAPGMRGDHSLNSEDMRHPGPLTPAAVLVPLVDRAEGMTVLLTQRAAHLNDHAGQISFPGGRMEAQDLNPQHAALREALEEVGLPPEHVTPVARLDDYETRTGFLIYPIVGIVQPPFPVKTDPFEVADVFEVPLSFILDRRNHRIESRFFKGYQRQFYVLPYEQRYIWGATAGMLVNLCDVLAD